MNSRTKEMKGRKLIDITEEKVNGESVDFNDVKSFDLAGTSIRLTSESSTIAHNFTSRSGIKQDWLRNFEGRANQFNAKGKRSFALYINDEAVAKALEASGVNVHWPKPSPNIADDPTRDAESYKLRPWVKVIVKQSGSLRIKKQEVLMDQPDENGNPTIYNRSDMNEDEYFLIDNLYIEDFDITLRTWAYQPGKYSLYLNTMYFTVPVDSYVERYGW
jgi:hypothetical protein